MSIGLITNKNKTMERYKDGDTIYILLTNIQAESVLTEWLDGNRQCDLHVRRSKKTKGHVIVETLDPYWAARIVDWCGCQKVFYKHKQ